VPGAFDRSRRATQREVNAVHNHGVRSEIQ
jgi:hypothetical protein